MIKFIELEFTDNRHLEVITSYSGGTATSPTGFLSEVLPDRSRQYETDPTDTDIVNMLAAYQLVNADDRAQVIYKYYGQRYAETAEAATATLPAPADWMLEMNYFYHTANPPTQELNTLLNHTTVYLFKASVTEPTAPSGVVFTGTGVDGWGNESANLDGWSRPSDIPTLVLGQNEILWSAGTTLTLSGSVFTQSPFIVSPDIVNQTVRYSADGVTWHFTQVTGDIWDSRRLPDGSWGPRNLIDPIGHLELLADGVEIGSRTGTLTAGQHIVLNHTDWSTVKSINIKRRQYEDAAGLAAGNFITTQTDFFPAQDLRIIDAQQVRSTRTPYYTNAAFISSQWGNRIIGGHAGVFTTSGSVDCIMSFTLANVTLGTNIAAHMDIAGISNSRTAITSVEIK